jgi:hypothetical protein
MAANIERGISPKTLLAAAVLLACSFATAAPLAGGHTPATEANEYPYYVEFRAAVDGVYGHSYIAYGRLNALGRPANATYVPTSIRPAISPVWYLAISSRWRHRPAQKRTRSATRLRAASAGRSPPPSSVG